jgi:peptidyl-prolyl cis-trans isomerase D
MLNVFRKHATSWLIKVALFLIVIVFIFWGGYSYQSREASRLAKVYDHYITYGEYQKSYDQLLENYRRQFGKMFSEDLVKQLNLKQQALDMVINRYILAKAAEDLGLTATDEEVQHSILQYPVFLNAGKFEQNRYVQVLRQARLSPELFESQLANDLSIQKVQEFIKRQAVVSEEEIRADFSFNNTLIELAYVAFDPKDFEKQVKPEETQLNTFYQEHQKQYQDPQKRQFALVMFKAENYLEGVKATDAEVQNYYEDHRKKYFKESQVKARHILFKIDQDASDEQVSKTRGEAEKVLAEARKKGADFAELAKKYSQDAASVQKGGDLGLFNREKMVPAFGDAAFSMKAGEISDLVRTPFGFHIIKVEEVQPEKTTSLDEARPEIEMTLKKEKGRDLANKEAQDFADLAYADKDLQKAAQNRKLPVQVTALLAQKDPLPELGATAKIMQPLFGLAKNEISGVLEAPSGFGVAQVLDIREAAVLPFEAVKERIQKDFTAEQARQLAGEQAAELLKAAKQQQSLEAAAKEKKLQVKPSGEFSRKKPDETLHLPPDAVDQVFLLSPAQPFGDAPVDTGNGYLVCQLLSKKEPAPEALAAELDSIRQRLNEQKQNQIWQVWLEQQHKKADVKMLHTL